MQNGQFMTAGESESPRTAVDDVLRNGWLDIWYQPKIDLKRKCLAGAEAFALVRHPQYGVSSLEDFPDDDAVRLTEHALVTALHDWASFLEAGFNLHLAIDISASALTELPIAGIVAENRPQSKDWPGLILEISEDQIVRDIAQTQKIAAALKACGVTIAVDNFGAGFSSFASLRGVPFAEIKIDASFAKDCAVDVTNAAICQTAIDLAHRFGSVAVAEGIASMADLQALVVMGCDFGQGPLVAPMMPMARFLDLLRQRLNPPQPQAAPMDEAAGRVA